VRAIAVSRDGQRAISGSFDQSAILWMLRTETASAVLRHHDGAVNAVAFLSDGRFLTGGEDGRIALWRAGAGLPERVFEAHRSPVVGLAVSPREDEVASASWDGTVRASPLAGGEARTYEGHAGNVNAVAYLPDGRIASAGYDGTVRVWSQAPNEPPLVTGLGSPQNALVVGREGDVTAAGADGYLHFLDAGGKAAGSLSAGAGPITSLALSGDGSRLAAATISGTIAVIDPAEQTVVRRLRAGQPVWSVAFVPGSDDVLAGGNDRLVRRWNLKTGEPVNAGPPGEDMLAGFRGDRGAEVFQACAACHTLTEDGGNRAGPTLHGVFGRRIGQLAGYNFSPALKSLDIVWSPDTISKLFEVGPSVFTPGTKMPEQRIGQAQDREALVRFLERATR
jgi:cytochrome c